MYKTTNMRRRSRSIILLVVLIPAMLFQGTYAAFMFFGSPTEELDDPFFNTPHIIAHRGGYAERPENTIEAFQFAYEQGIRVIELDVRMTKDLIPIAMHDSTLNRTTDGQGPVNGANWSYIETLDAGEYFSPEFDGIGVPTMAEVFNWLADRKDLVLWVHLRFQVGDQILAGLIEEHKVQSQIVIQVYAGEYDRFDHYPDCLGRAVIIKQPLLALMLYNIEMCKKNDVQFITFPDKWTSDSLIDLANRNGIRLMLTRNFVTTEEHIAERFEMGAWGYIINSSVLGSRLASQGMPPERAES